MDEAQHDSTGIEPPGDLTLQDAALLYAVSARTLAQHIRCGQLPAYKASGATAREWRVTRAALDAAGYPPRHVVTEADASAPPLVAKLRREVSAAKRAAAAERRRAEDADRRLGHALLECGRLRAALAVATGAEAASAQPYLDAAEAQDIVDTVRGTSTDLRVPQEHA